MNVVTFAKPRNDSDTDKKAVSRFTSRKLTWLDRIARDSQITPLGFRVAFILSGYLNAETGEAYPAQPKIAEAVGAKTRSVQKLLDSLERAGYIRISAARGRGHTNVYTMLDGAAEKANAHSPIETVKHESRFAFCDQETTENTNPGAIKHVPPSVHNTLEHLKRKESHDSSNQGSEDFDRWWQKYPKKVGKLKAQQVYGRIIKNKTATAAQLDAGATRYEADPARDNKYTKDPCTWLNAGCWLDEPPQKPRFNIKNSII